jgi:segregation and condensation protein B
MSRKTHAPQSRPIVGDDPEGFLLTMPIEGDPMGGSLPDQPEHPQGKEPVPEEALGPQPLKPLLEALLLVAREPLSLDRLASVIDVVPKGEIGQALRSLQEEYDQAERGLQVVLVAGGYQLVTRPEYGSWIKRLDKSKSAPKLSRSALESLAIISYKQPIVRSEIEAIRGVETSGVLRTLLERKLVRIVGRKDMPGRPILYGTTKIFLQHFGLRDLSDLPPLREFKELGEAEQASLPVGDDPLVLRTSQDDPEGNGNGSPQNQEPEDRSD